MIQGLESAARYREFWYRLIGEDIDFPPGGFIAELDRPEYSFLKRELLWGTQVVVTSAVAAQFGFLQAFNNIATRLVVILGFIANKASAGPMNVALTTTVRGVTGNTFPIARDTRWNNPPLAGSALVARDSVVVTNGATASFGGDIPLEQYQIGTTPTPITLLQPIILAPGSGFVLTDTTVNEVFTASLLGYSRGARSEEIAQG